MVTSRNLRNILEENGRPMVSYHKSLCEVTVDIHEMLNCCPKYLSTLLKLWTAGFKNNSEKIGKEKERLNRGLAKLKDMHETVDRLTKEARVKEEELTRKERLANEALEGIEKGLEEAAKYKAEVAILGEKTKNEEMNSKRKHARIEEELAEIRPVLEEARRAVGSIKQDNLNEIRALKMPPEAIHDVLYGVLILMGSADESWNAMRKFLSGSGVIQKVLNFDARKVSEKTRGEVEKLLESRGRSFEDAVIRRASLAAAPLALWVKAIVR